MKVLISGYYGFGNIGDEAILEAIVQGLKNWNPEIEITILKRRGLGFIRQIWEADLLISGGGTLFQDATSKRSFYYYAGIILLAKLLGKKNFFFAQGFGPLRSLVGRWIARFLLNHIDLITLRDEDAMEELERIGVKKSINLTADPTLILELPRKEEGERILSLEGISQDKPLLGVSVRSVRQGEKIFAKLAETLDSLINRNNYHVVFLPFQYPEDLGPIERVMDLMHEKAAVVFRICRPKEMLAIISRLEMLIGMRLHALMFAAMNAVPMVGLAYDPKVRSFLKEISQPSLNLSEIDKIEETIGRIEKEKQTIILHLNATKEELKQRANKNFELLRILAS